MATKATFVVQGLINPLQDAITDFDDTLARVTHTIETTLLPNQGMFLTLGQIVLKTFTPPCLPGFKKIDPL